MHGLRFLCLLTILPATGMVTASYFVLLVNSKLENCGLKRYGFCVVGLLWTVAVFILLLGIILFVKFRNLVIS